jgi:ABC-type histidine transport system ATPase subunit
MVTVQAIFEKFGGFTRLKRIPIRIDNGDHPALVIQYPGKTGVGACDYLRVMRIEEIEGEISRECLG